MRAAEFGAIGMVRSLQPTQGASHLDLRFHERCCIVKR